MFELKWRSVFLAVAGFAFVVGEADVCLAVFVGFGADGVRLVAESVVSRLCGGCRAAIGVSPKVLRQTEFQRVAVERIAALFVVEQPERAAVLRRIHQARERKASVCREYELERMSIARRGRTRDGVAFADHRHSAV